MQRYKHHNQFFSSSPDQYHRTTRTKRAYPQSTPHPHRLQPFSSPRSRRHTASLVARGCDRGDSPFVRRGCVHLLHLELKRKAPHGRSIEHGYERLREPSVVMMGQEQSPKLHSVLPRLEYYSMELEWYSTKFSGWHYTSSGTCVPGHRRVPPFSLLLYRFDCAEPHGAAERFTAFIVTRSKRVAALQKVPSP